MERPRRDGSRILFEDQDGRINTLAFESEAPKTGALPFPCPVPSLNKVYLAQDDFFFSSHNLKDLIEITPCAMKEGIGITGLLLLFADGHRACVGQIRLDSLSASVTVSDYDPWYLSFGRLENIYPHVTALGVTRAEVEEGNHCVLEIFCHGKLEWIWSRRQCFVMYEGQISPYTV